MNQSNNSFTLPAGSIPISLSESSKSKGKVEPITKVPFKSFYTAPSSFEISKINIIDLVNLLEKTINGIKKLRWVKITDFVYSVEYDPIEGLQINPNDKQYKNKFWLGLRASQVALKKFPHNYNDFYDYNDELPGPVMPGINRLSLEYWFKMEIRLYYDNEKEKDCFILEMNRLKGESFTFYNIYNQLKHDIKQSLNWLMRKNYINLLEGVDLKQGEENHIEHYLLDELICREICSYLYEEINKN